VHWVEVLRVELCEGCDRRAEDCWCVEAAGLGEALDAALRVGDVEQAALIYASARRTDWRMDVRRELRRAA
jgi:hypothetical protein